MRVMRMLVLCLVCAIVSGALGVSGADAFPAASGWGSNTDGQLGDGTTENSLAPIPVSDLGEVAAVASGSDHSLALLANGTVMAWGANNVGQLGDGNNTSSDLPVPVSGLSNVTAIASRRRIQPRAAQQRSRHGLGRGRRRKARRRVASTTPTCPSKSPGSAK